MRMPTKLMLLLLLAIAATIAGCGSDESSSGGDSGGGDGEKAAFDEDLKELLEKRGEASIKVTYEMSGTVPGADPSSSELSIAFDETRTAFSVGDMTMYQEGTTSTMCTGGGDAPTCFENNEADASSQEDMRATFFGAADDLKADAEGLERADDREIAGRDAMCWEYNWAGLMGDANTTVCLDKETGGMLLTEVAGESDGEEASFSITATEFGEATEEDLTPPEGAKDLAGITEDLQNAAGK